ncbi:MAG: hypothetical protein AAB449_01450 [Patescibacteria group bacterium]
MQENNQKDAPVSAPKTPTLSWSQPARVTIPATTQKPPVIPPPKAPITSVMPAHYGRGALAGSFVVGLIAGVVLGWVWTARDQKPEANSAGTATSTSKPSTSSTDDSTTATESVTQSGIAVAAQPAGLDVEVSNVVVSKPTWVVVYESRGGALGNALGAKLFFPISQGGGTSGSITLLRTTLAGGTYFIGQHVDNGDGKFTKLSDEAVLGAEGEQLVVSFTAK